MRSSRPHKAKVMAYRRRYYLANKDRVLAYSRRYHRAHKAEVAAQSRRWRQSHRTEVVAAKRRYRRSYQGKVAARASAARYRRGREGLFRNRYRAQASANKALRMLAMAAFISTTTTTNTMKNEHTSLATTSTIADPTTARFLQCVREGIDRWKEAGQIAAIQTDPEWVDRACDAAAAAGLSIITPQLIYKFQRIGLGQLAPLLAYETGAWVTALARLPYPEQERYAHGSVTLLINQGGEYVPQHSNARALTTDQVRQVFARDHVRTEAEQRNWLLERAARKVAPAAYDEPYRIVRGKVVAMVVGWTLGRKELIRLLGEVTAD